MPTLIFILINLFTVAQHPSIHQEQSGFYKKSGVFTCVQYDSINHFSGRQAKDSPSVELQKRVFGYHPYWMGSAWQNYQWNLLTDLCYFSYDTDPATGNPSTTNEFETAAVIDTALAHGVKVHLCVTLFSGHALFFGNPQAQQTLIGNLIALLIQRGIQGINIDFEAVPASQQESLTAFMLQLSAALHTIIPGAELSIAAPAVNWDNTWDMLAIAPALDLVMVMAYDYYWGGSDLAGPVSGFWPLTSSFNYGVNKSLTYYQSQGVPAAKLLLGLPYYGREWPVNANTLPAGTTGSGTAVTYRNVRSNSSGFYTPSNLYWDARSYNPYYSYFNNSWRQCFFDDVRSLGAKYNLVNRRNTAGIGIWALGYDNGYDDLWNLIALKFGQAPVQPCRDTLHDSGGPWWNYSDRERYSETVMADSPGPLNLKFEEFSLESGFDTLWIYDGPDVNSPLLGTFSGNEIPLNLATTGNTFTIGFYSDGATTRAGYSLVWSCPTASVNAALIPAPIVFPNPAGDVLHIRLDTPSQEPWTASLYDITGKIILSANSGKHDQLSIPVSHCRPGMYVLKVAAVNGIYATKIVISR